MSGQVVGYVRVSSVEQNTARQVAALGEVEETFTDRVSGKRRGDRPALATMLRHVRRGEIVRGRFDGPPRPLGRRPRPARPGDHQPRIRVEFVTERLGFDLGTDDPFATFQLHLLGAVAQLERSLIRERKREGIEIAKAKGVYRGRARKLTPEQVAGARHRVEAGVAKA